MSWKVRRAAAKCLDAVVSTRHEMLPEFYKTVSPALISRFKEREENVKADVFHAYLSLLKQTRPVQSWLCDPDAMEQGETPLTMLQSQVSLKVWLKVMLVNTKFLNRFLYGNLRTRTSQNIFRKANFWDMFM